MQVISFSETTLEVSKRQLNIIIHNVEEPSADNGKVRKGQDVQKVMSIFDVQ